MNPLVALAQHITDSGIASQEEDLFINMMPAKVSNGVLLRNPINGTKINYEIVGHYNTEFKVIVRTTSFANGDTRMRELFALLTISNQKIGNIMVKHCYPDNEPISYPISEGNIIELATDFKLVCSEVA